MRYQNEELSFAIDSIIEGQYVVVLADNKKFDEDRDLVKIKAQDLAFFPDFLSPDLVMTSSFEPLEEDLTAEELQEKMVEAGFIFDVNLQAHLDDLSKDEEYEDNETDDDDDVFFGQKQQYTFS